WARGRGEVGSEWRFRVSPPGKAPRPLVPDLAFVRIERLRGLAGRDLQIPALAPDLAVEILSPGDRRIDIDHKIGVYLSAGSALVMVVDPRRRVVELHDATGVRELGERDVIEHESLPGFSFAVAELFAVLKPPR
ncbi:MAG: Uma2 family endonuclease, partial [Vulcanimicrobiaceae bacterium]